MAETGLETKVLLSHIIKTGVSYTPGATTTYTAAFQTLGNSSIDVHYLVDTAATGTAPTMTLQLFECDDQGVHQKAIGSATATFTAADDNGTLSNISVYCDYVCLKVVVNNADNVFPSLSITAWGV